MGMAMMKKISKIDEDDFDGVSRAILLPESSGSFFVPAAVKQYFDELIDDDSDLYGDSDDETCLEILPQVPSVACNIVGKIVIGIFAPEDPRSEMSSDDESIIGINRLSDVYLPPHGSTAWAALRALINRPWFSRIWVIQEVAVAEKALVICGKDVLSWKVVERAAEVMMAASFPDDAGGRSWMNIVTMKGAGTVYRDEESGEEDTNDIRSHGLLKLLTSTLHTNASDPKDKIFGLYGLLPESTAPKPPSVNYDTSVEILYRDVARFLIEEDNHLIVLQMQGVERKLKKLPSWVPDWSVPTNFASIIAPPDDDDDDQGSDIKLRAIIKKSDNPDELILGAKRLGVVVWAGKAVKQCASEKETKHSMEAALEDWVAFTAGALNMAPGTPGEDKAETFWRTIIANTDGSMDEPPKEYRMYCATWLAQLGLEVNFFEITNGGNNKDRSSNQRDVERYISDVVWTCRGRRLCMTDSGSLCLAHKDVEEGDSLVFFIGGQIPFVIRQKDDFYIFLGPCYIHGFNSADIIEIMTEDIVLR